MSFILPALQEILCDPETGHSVSYQGDHFQSENGRRFPIVAGIPIFKTVRQPLRHTIWEWVYNLTAFSYDFGVRYAWQFPLGGAPISRDSYLEKLSLKPGNRILETAVGTGDNLVRLPEEAICVGVDLSFRMLQRCRRKIASAGRSAALIQADMTVLPFFEKTFDAVLHVGGLQFVQDPEAGVREMHRVAREGAEVIIVDETATLKNLLRRARVSRLEQLVPPKTEKVHSEIISEGEFFLLKFTRT